MKTLITFIVLLLFSILTKAQCDLKTVKDQFTGRVMKSTNKEAIGKSLYGNLSLYIAQQIKQDTSTAFFVYIEPTSMTCLGSDSKILIKSGEKIITIKLSGKIDCESEGNLLLDYALPTTEDIAFLKTNQVEAIRVYFTEGYGDFDFKKTDYFIRTLKCFE
jgi:hypothetical protein